MLTLEVKSTFDAVLPGRGVRRIREQGWQDNLVTWVSKFLNKISVVDSHRDHQSFLYFLYYICPRCLRWGASPTGSVLQII